MLYRYVQSEQQQATRAEEKRQHIKQEKQRAVSAVGLNIRPGSKYSADATGNHSVACDILPASPVQSFLYTHIMQQLYCDRHAVH